MVTPSRQIGILRHLTENLNLVLHEQLFVFLTTEGLFFNISIVLFYILKSLGSLTLSRRFGRDLPQGRIRIPETLVVQVGPFTPEDPGS